MQTAQARPPTVLERALAARVLPHLSSPEPGAAGLLDLTTAAPPVVPEVVRAAAKQALDQGETHYTSGSGIPALRAALAAHVSADGFPADAGTIGITNGGTEAIYIALQSALRPGDRALYVEPITPHIVELLRFVGAEPVALPTQAADGFLPRADAVAQAGARLLLLASPSPVSGLAIPPRRLRELLGTARAAGMSVILDRSYAPGMYAPPPPFPDAELAAQIITVGSFSAVHGLGGWRVGYYSAPPADIATFNNLKQSMSICTTAVSQFAARAALDDAPTWLDERKRSVAAARDTAVALLSRADLRSVVPDALPPLLIDVRWAGDDRALARRIAREAGVVVEPGSRFGRSSAGFLRINLDCGHDRLREGLGRAIPVLRVAREEVQP